MKRTIVTLTAGSMMMMTAAFAQPNVVGARNENQQDRIAQGTGSGSLTAGETAHLESKEAALHHEVRTDRSLNDGRLTNQERTIVNGQQNRLSNQIYRDKHNAATQRYGNNLVDARRYNQQQRIADGIASGQSKAGEAAHLEKGESAINQETRVDRTLNGGRLTPGEKTAINRQQNVMSARVYNRKHN